MTLALLFTLASTSLHLPPHLLPSVCYVESKFQVTAINKVDGGTGSYGICQIKYSTAKSLGFKGTVSDLMKPDVNIFYAGKVLEYHIKQCRNLDSAILAYSSGTCGKGTQSYLKQVKQQLKVSSDYNSF